MPILPIFIGQCGNQIGSTLMQVLAEDSDGDTWFRHQKCNDKKVARSIFVDTEEKVIREIQRSKSSSWCYNVNNLITLKDGGSGNNWAYGYSVKGPALLEIAMNRIRKELEFADRRSCFLTVLSSSGGTGSGVGTFICESLSDEFPRKPLVCAIVLPYQSGEVVIQNYNSLLTLSNLNNCVDMNIIFENDHLHKMCNVLLNQKKISFKDLNHLIAVKLASVFQPVDNISSNIFDVVRVMSSHPSFKFVSIKSAPHCSQDISKFEMQYSWNTLSNHMFQTLRVNALKNDRNFDVELKQPGSTSDSTHCLMQYTKCIANLLTTRGSDSDLSVANINAKWTQSSLYPEWTHPSLQFGHFHRKKQLLHFDKFISLASNNASIFNPINYIVNEAWNMYNYKAYLHNYSQYNIGEKEFISSFLKLESILKMYKSLG